MASQSNANDGVLLGACAAAIASLVPPALLQTGLIRTLPDIDAPIFAAQEITQSPVAHPLGAPSALIGLATFTATFGLALAARHSPTARKLLGAKLLLDAGIAAYDLTLEGVVFRKVSPWSIATAAATVTMLVAAAGPVSEAYQIALHTGVEIVDTI